ncbi:Elongation of fatty acids protein 3-like [Linum perenne]
MDPSKILSTLNYWLVDHPQILNFTWSPGQTFASTPQFLAAAVISYLILTLLLRRVPFPPLPPSLLKPLTAAHSLILFLLSAVMSAGCLLSIFSPHTRSIRHAVCFPPATAPSGPLFFWAYVFYLSKYLEFGDTLLIILSKSNQRLTFLHVYHHATVVVMCYLWLSTAQSLFPVALVTNATVHVVMYYYYFRSAVGSRPRWKRLVTDFQIVQFVFSFGISGLMLYYHFVGGGCSGMAGWCFNAVFNASLLALFVDFHGKSYKKRKEAEKKIATKIQ